MLFTYKGATPPGGRIWKLCIDVLEIFWPNLSSLKIWRFYHKPIKSYSNLSRRWFWAFFGLFWPPKLKRGHISGTDWPRNLIFGSLEPPESGDYGNIPFKIWSKNFVEQISWHSQNRGLNGPWKCIKVNYKVSQLTIRFTKVRLTSCCFVRAISFWDTLLPSAPLPEKSY